MARRSADRSRRGTLPPDTATRGTRAVQHGRPRHHEGAARRAAGFHDVGFRSIDEPVWFGSDADDAYSFVSTLGITRGLTADLDDAARAAALDQLHQTLKRHETADGVVLAGSAWLVTATNGTEAG